MGVPAALTAEPVVATGYRRVFRKCATKGESVVLPFDPPIEPSGVEDAEHVFKRAGLPLPPIPDRFVKNLRRIEPWCYATRQIDPMGMYFFDDYIWEAVAGKTPDYLAFSHAGHGINSYALNYHLVDGPLLLIVQAGWGGAYSRRKQDVDVVGRLFVRCAALVAAVTDTRGKNLFGAVGRLCVFESEMRQSFSWGLLDQPAVNEREAETWVRAHALDRQLARRREADLPTSQALRFIARGR
jgi:hypothetical protein